MVRHNKLVRDKIPDIIRQDGKNPFTHIATNEEYLQKLREKLGEEIREFLESGEIKELADILEVVKALGESLGKDWKSLGRIRQKRAVERGRFAKKIILEKVEG